MPLCTTKETKMFQWLFIYEHFCNFWIASALGFVTFALYYIKIDRVCRLNLAPIPSLLWGIEHSIKINSDMVKYRQTIPY